jgi:putative ABC transport system ATP-binding protein
MSFIEFRDINLKYGERQIFEDFNLSIEAGEKVLITGKSGQGKSTLLQLLLGFACPDDGHIYVDGGIIQPKDFKEIRKQFAFVNQDVSLRPGKAAQVLEEVAAFSGNTYDGSFDEALASLFEFDLNLLEKDTEDLSGGERQRLGIILAIMLDRPAFLLDEVTSGLDRELKEKVVQFFCETEKTVITVSHDKEWQKQDAFRKVVLS